MARDWEQIQRPYQICTRCVMDTTDPEITFDSDGICNHCTEVETRFKPRWFPDERGVGLLGEMIEEVKANGKGQRYDSIIGLSGGVDSAYLAVKVAEWGLRPLAVHVDAGWNSEIAVKNIDQIVTRVGLDLHTHVVDWEEMRDVQLAFMRSNVANLDVPQDHAFFAALYNYASANNIRYVISGSNYATESILPMSWGYDAMDARHLRSIHERFGAIPLKTFPVVDFLKYHYLYPKKMTVLRPLNLMPYRKDDAIAYLEKNYGFRYYGGKHYESRWTRFYEGYFLPAKFGYEKRKAHLSSMICSGEISRSKALEELEKALYTENELQEDKVFVAKKLGISVAELDDLVAQPKRYYWDYPNNEKRAQLFHALHSSLQGFLSRL